MTEIQNYSEPEEIRDAYRHADVATKYCGARFTAPLGHLLHVRQTAALRRLISEAGIHKVLEIAPGPGRLTTELSDLVRQGVAVDGSMAMLREMTGRLASAGMQGWSIVQGDAFNLPLAGEWALVYTFRLIRHFRLPARMKLYAEIRRVLKPGGFLMFDAVNESVSGPLRRAAPHEYQHYDAMMRPEPLRAELESAGFGEIQLQGVQHRARLLGRVQVLLAPRSAAAARTALSAIDRFGGGEPLEWIVTCRRA
jgi:ubiquinone/menaquinone biosynthesis C-methylase UbiE